ncbi:MAG: hypothetical protein AB7O62_22345, partial [Pirellulales bacterium]
MPEAQQTIANPEGFVEQSLSFLRNLASERTPSLRRKERDMVAAVKASYKITNWKQYNESLVKRGSITFWFDDEVVQNWKH